MNFNTKMLLCAAGNIISIASMFFAIFLNAPLIISLSFIIAVICCVSACIILITKTHKKNTAPLYDFDLVIFPLAFGIFVLLIDLSGISGGWLFVLGLMTMAISSGYIIYQLHKIQKRKAYY